MMRVRIERGVMNISKYKTFIYTSKTVLINTSVLEYKLFYSQVRIDEEMTFVNLQANALW